MDGEQMLQEATKSSVPLLLSMLTDGCQLPHDHSNSWKGQLIDEEENKHAAKTKSSLLKNTKAIRL